MIGFIPTKKRLALSLGVVLALGGCKEVLYSNLSEHDANDMVAILAAGDIEVSRDVTKKGAYSLLVQPEDVAPAIVLLRGQGFPRQEYLSLGDVFDAGGIIGTPFEEHARFIHAMNEELAHTISEVDGVRSTRVLVTSPPKGRYDQSEPRATASVSIQHEADFDAVKHVPSIKLLVAYSLPNLTYDDVAVALFAAGGPQLRVLDPTTASLATRSYSMMENQGALGLATIYQGHGTWITLLGILFLLGAGMALAKERILRVKARR